MVFSSVSFLIYFLPLLLIVYFAVPKRFINVRNAVLLTASLIFYGWGGASFLVLLLISSAVNYICALGAAPGKSKTLRTFCLVFAAAAGLGLLGVFKYAGFFARTLNTVGIDVPVPEITLPVGISFFTFQGLSYVVDVYRGDAPVQKNPLNVALYIALFPQLVAGPIVRYTTVAQEIVKRDENLDEFSAGMVRFLFGLGKKMLLANAMGEVADAAFNMGSARLTVSMAWLGAAAYTLQIYFDFSAYSDMAIGLGGMFGFHFLENFNYPYISSSVTEFWRRWHISLSSWFRDYLYIPLGGSRCSRGKHIRNLAAVWLLTGLWHGADWTFILWGAWFLVLLMGEKFLWGGVLNKLPKAAGRVYTMLMVMLSWVLFRADSMGNAISYFAAMAGNTPAGAFSGETVYYLKMYLPEFIVCIIACLPVKQMAEGYLLKKDAPVCRAVLIWWPKLAALALLAVSYLKLVTGSFNPFIYFQF